MTSQCQKPLESIVGGLDNNMNDKKNLPLNSSYWMEKTDGKNLFGENCSKQLGADGVSQNVFAAANTRSHQASRPLLRMLIDLPSERIAS